MFDRHLNSKGRVYHNDGPEWEWRHFHAAELREACFERNLCIMQ